MIPDDALASELEAYVNRDSMLLDDEPEKEPATDAPKVADQPPAAEPVQDGTTPPTDPATPAADPLAPDPFAALVKDAKPMPFRVNGAERLHDLILEVPGRGAVIPADKLDAFRNTVARSESNAEAVTSLLAEREQYEALGGVEKFHAQEERFAAINAVGLLLLDAIENPLSLVALDAQNNVVPNTDRLAMLRQQVDIARREAVYETRTKRSDAVSTRQGTAQETQARQRAIPDTLDGEHFAKYNPEDRAAAKAFFGKNPDAYTFKVTAENAAQYGQPLGTLMVRADLLRDYLDERVALRGTAQTDQQKRAAALKENATRVTTRPAPKPAAQPRAKDGTFVEAKRARWTKDEMIDRALAGKSNDPNDDE